MPVDRLADGIACEHTGTPAESVALADRLGAAIDRYSSFFPSSHQDVTKKKQPTVVDNTSGIPPSPASSPPQVGGLQHISPPPSPWAVAPFNLLPEEGWGETAQDPGKVGESAVLCVVSAVLGGV